MKSFSMNRLIIIVAAVIAVLALIFFAIFRERSRAMHGETIAAGKIVQLPPARSDSAKSVEKSLLERRSIREYGKEPLKLEEIGQLLWAAQGITHGGDLRSAPSAGGLYPLETYLVAGRVANLEPGVYRYLPKGHRLVMVVSGDVRGKLGNESLYQDPVTDAPASIVFGAVITRTTDKYGKRGIRYVHMEAGIAAQNVSLQSVSLNLGTVVIGAFDDDGVRRVLSMPADVDPLLIMPVGKR